MVHSPNDFRFYSFVANLYLSPLQCGLQTAHAVSEMSRNMSDDFDEWADYDKTIIICAAHNHGGVLDAYNVFNSFNLDLHIVVFREDEESMNSMATACGVLVPQKYWNVELMGASGDKKYYLHTILDSNGYPVDHIVYPEDIHGGPNPEFRFIEQLKSYRLA